MDTPGLKGLPAVFPLYFQRWSSAKRPDIGKLRQPVQKALLGPTHGNQAPSRLEINCRLDHGDERGIFDLSGVANGNIRVQLACQKIQVEVAGRFYWYPPVDISAPNLNEGRQIGANGLLTSLGIQYAAVHGFGPLVLDMSESVTFILSIVFLVVFWVAVIWLFISRMGNTIIRWFAFTITPLGLAVALYLHWEPYAVMICLPTGFVAGLLFAEWFYDIKGITALRSGLQRQHQLLEREDRFQQAQRPWLDSEHDALTFRCDPAAKPRA